MRLIDADSAKLSVSDYKIFRCQLGGLMDVAEFIGDQPTINAVPVVRCWECKHFRHYGKTSLFIKGKNIKAGWCQRRIRYDEEYRMTADDFCSYGKRKEGAD